MLLIVTPVLSATIIKDKTEKIKIESYKETKQKSIGVIDKDPKLKPDSFISKESTAKLSTNKQIESLDSWDVLLMIELTQSGYTAGIGTDENYIYAPEWFGTNIYYWDFNGVYQGSFTISGVSDLRDLAYDHKTGYIWGGNGDGMCWEMDFESQTLVSTITGSFQCRAIAYSENDDWLYMSGWGDPVYIVEKDGTIVDTFDLSLTTSTYGFAYDKWDEAAPLLWVHDQGGTGSQILAYSLEEEKFMEGEWYYHDVTQEIPGGIAGGLCLYDNCPGHRYDLIVNVQASPDTIILYEMGIFLWSEHDIAVESINLPKSDYADDDLKMQTTFKNNGNNTETFDAQMTVLTSNETGEILLYENFSTYGTGPNGLPENWTTDWWKWCNCSGNPCACVYYYDQYMGGDYYDNYITTPKINCSGLEKVSLEFNLKADVQYSCYIYLKYRKNESSSWRDITPWENPVAGDFQDWFRISMYDYQQGGDLGDAVQINWSFNGYYSYFRNIYLDDVKLEAYNTSAEYAEIVEDISVPKCNKISVDFPSWTPSLWQNESYENKYKEYSVKAEALIDDDNPYNNIKYKSVKLYFPWMDDVGSVRVNDLQSGSAQIFDMKGIIKNSGQNKEYNFKTYVEIVEKEFNKTEYNNSILVESIEPQTEQELDFNDWTPEFLAEEKTGQKEFTVKMWTSLDDPPDKNPDNDLYQESFVLDFFHDVEIACIPSLQECGEDEDEVLFYQRIYTPFENWTFYTSSSDLKQKCYDDWYEAVKPIEQFGVIGLSLVYPWSQCNDPFMRFEVIIYDGATEPSTILQKVSNQVPQRIIDTKMTYGSYGNATEWQFGEDNGIKPVNIERGWLSVQSTYSESNCNFLWGAGPDGNNNARQNETALYTNLGMNLSMSGKIADVYVLPGTQNIDVLIKNIGTFPEYNMTCDTEIYEYITNCTNGTLVYEDNITNIDLPDPLGGSKELHFNDFNFANEGLYQLIVNLSDDNDDNEMNNIYSLEVGVDDTSPVSYHSLNPPDPDGENGYYISDVEVTICATDPEIGCGYSGSGVKGFRVRNGNGSWQYILGNCISFIVDEEGDILIEYSAIDNAGNIEPINTFTINIDKTPPVAEEISWDAYKQQGFWYVDLTATATDSISGMDRVEFFINNGYQEIIEGSGPDYVFTIQWSEAFRKLSFTFYHYDRAGNRIMVYFDPNNVKSVPQLKGEQLVNQILKTTCGLLTNQ
jgi:hypothetical protein